MLLKLTENKNTAHTLRTGIDSVKEKGKVIKDKNIRIYEIRRYYILKHMR